MNMEKVEFLQLSLRERLFWRLGVGLRDNWDSFQILKVDNSFDQFEDGMG